MALQHLSSLKINDKNCKLSASGETVYYDFGHGTTTLRGVKYKNGVVVDLNGKRLSDFEIINKILS